MGEITCTIIGSEKVFAQNVPMKIPDIFRPINVAGSIRAFWPVFVKSGK